MVAMRVLRRLFSGRSGLDTIKAVMDALDEAGVELTNHGQPGCRIKSK
jgi:hypothetical protein